MCETETTDAKDIAIELTKALRIFKRGREILMEINNNYDSMNKTTSTIV